MLKSTSCPDLRAYRALTSGQLAVAETESLLRHLETCDACAGKIHTLPASDTLIEWIGQIKTSPPSPNEKQLAPLMERLIQLAKSPAGSSVVLPSTLTFSCSACGKRLRVKAVAAGKKVKCPHCGKVVQAPPVDGSGVAPAGSVGVETVDARSAPSDASQAGMASGTATIANLGQSNKERELCSFLAAAQMPDELGRLGSYRVLQVLGAGGMGVVFRAEDPQLQRPVALKAMLPALAANESARLRFLREARLAASLKHDHIVTIHQVGEDGGSPFLAMEFLEGEALEDRLKREGKLPLPEVLRIGREIADGLQAAHEHGLIHRDIKPANVWLEGKRGRVKILDFGLARSSADDVHLTQSGAIVGTPAYMPPEQARGEIVDSRCDLYSLGCVLYRLSTGELPFKGENTMSLLMALAMEQPKSPREINPDVPPALADLIMRLLAKDAAQRPATAGEVAQALQDIAEAKTPAPAATPPAPPRRRRKLLWAAAAGSVALAAMLTVIIVRLGKPEEGSVTIETVDPDVELVFHSGGRDYTVRDKKTGEEIKLPLGNYQVSLKGDKDGLKLETNQFTLKRGERVLVKVTRQAAEKAAAAAQAKKQPVQVIDLVELFRDTDRISVKGFTEKNQWTKAEGKLTYTSDGHSGKVMIPVSLNNVRDYEIDARVRRLSGNSVFTFDLLITPTRQTGLDIYIGGRIELKLEGGQRSQIGAWPASVGNAGRIVTRVRFDADGRHGSVTVTVEGHSAARWSGDLSAIGTPIEFHPAFPGEQVPGMFCFQDSFEFSSWQLRVYEGRAQVLSRRASVPPVQIPEPPPLAEWLKGRKVLTVAQDGKGQFKNIQAALNALKPHEVIQVLDRGPYYERLELKNVPQDTGLISEVKTVLELREMQRIHEWREGGKDVYKGHRFEDTDGFRLSGFHFILPSVDGLAKLPGGFVGQGIHANRPGGFVLENCKIQDQESANTGDWSSLFLGFFEGGSTKPACVRDCLIEGRLGVAASNKDASASVLIEHNYLKGSSGKCPVLLYLSGPGGYGTVAIRHNILDGSPAWADLFMPELEHVKTLDVHNNILASSGGSSPIGIVKVPRGAVRFHNNLSLRPGFLVFDTGKEKQQVEAIFRTWQVGHNSYPRLLAADETDMLKFPQRPGDVVSRAEFLSRDPQHADYLRIAADSPLAKAGAGGAWPSYIGALPPGSAPKDGDWFTRLRAKWLQDKPAAKK